MVNKMSSTDRERRNKGGSGVNDPSSWQVHLRKPCYDFSVLRVVNDKVQATCLILFLYPISIPSSKVTHTGSIHKYTQLVMLTHYSPL